MRNIVFESVTNVWIICDPFVRFIWDPYVTMVDPHVTHRWPICNASHHPYVIHLWTMFDSYVTYVRLICDQSVIHPVTHIWPISNPSDDSYVASYTLYANHQEKETVKNRRKNDEQQITANQSLYTIHSSSKFCRAGHGF